MTGDSIRAALSGGLQLGTIAQTHANNVLLVFVVLAVLVVLLALWIGRVRPGARRRRRQARRIIARLATITHPGQQFAYLRKIDPFTFEELLLTSFQQRGLKIIRNRRYTGDGGIDGQFHFQGGRVLIQAKRYSTAINPAHVAEFAQLCQQQNRRGVFIHTGRTGTTSRKVAADYPGVAFISGDTLLALIAGRPFDLFGDTLT